PNHSQSFNPSDNYQKTYQISTFPTTSTKTARLIAKGLNAPILEFSISNYALIGVFSTESGPVDIDLSLFPDSDTISKHHAEIYFQNGLWLVKDQSFNGTYIKPIHQTKFGERITLSTPLNSGDEIAFAKTAFIFQYPY
ncbi:MAG: FHA domain-containing protein, partial [Microcystaceae cyanobacterium]